MSARPGHGHRQHCHEVIPSVHARCMLQEPSVGQNIQAARIARPAPLASLLTASGNVERCAIGFGVIHIAMCVGHTGAHQDRGQRVRL